MKRALIIVAAVLVVIGIGVIIYLTFGPTAPHLTVAQNTSFGGNGSPVTTTTSVPGETTTSTGAGTVVGPNLVEITNSPVAAGVSVIDIPPATTTASIETSLASSTATATTTTTSMGDIAIRYIDRESGNIYEYRVQARSLTRILDKTLPGIQQASWLPDGSLALARFLSDTSNSESLDTYALSADDSAGYFLAQDLDEANIIGPNSVFTLAAGTEGTIGTIAHLDGTDASTLFTSPLSSIIVYSAGNSFVAVTKAASEIGGYAFSINPATGNFTPILGPLDGLTALPSPSGQLLLYSYTNGGAYHMGVFDLVNGSLTTLPVATITDKCVWTSDSSAIYCGIPTSFSGNLPDDWYQGAVSFTDRIWRIDLTDRLATLIVDPMQNGSAAIDVVNPTLDANDQVLVFRNKKDSSLWAYTL